MLCLEAQPSASLMSAIRMSCPSLNVTFTAVLYRSSRCQWCSVCGLQTDLERLAWANARVCWSYQGEEDSMEGPFSLHELHDWLRSG